MDPLRPFRIVLLELPNRLVMAPVKTGYGTGSGEVTYRHEAYYLHRAERGIGSIIVEPLFIDPVEKNILSSSVFHPTITLRDCRSRLGGNTRK